MRIILPIVYAFVGAVTVSYITFTSLTPKVLTPFLCVYFAGALYVAPSLVNSGVMKSPLPEAISYAGAFAPALLFYIGRRLFTRRERGGYDQGRKTLF